MRLDPESGVVVSQYHKKHGGFRGFIHRNMNSIRGIGAIVSTVGQFIPGWGQIAGAVAQSVTTAAEMIDKGKIKIRDLLNTAISWGAEQLGISARDAKSIGSMLGGLFGKS
jgi:hypothetical protein